MIFESFAIIAIIVAMSVIFLRTKRKDLSVGLLPLLILPAMQLLIKPITALITELSPIKPLTVNFCMVFLALIAECILLGLASIMFTSKRQKTSYLLICGIFSLVLAMLFMLNLLK